MVALHVPGLGMSRKVSKHKEKLIGTMKCPSGAPTLLQLLEYWYIIDGQEIIAKWKNAKGKEGTMQN